MKVCLEKYLKTKFALKSAGKLAIGLEKHLNFTAGTGRNVIRGSRKRIINTRHIVVHVIKILMWLKWVKVLCAHTRVSGDRHKKHEQSLSGTFTNFFIKKETKVKTEPPTTASTPSPSKW